MIYTTMTRNKVLRLVYARGWHVTERLMRAIQDNPDAAYFEIARCGWYLDGEVYDGQ